MLCFELADSNVATRHVCDQFELAAKGLIDKTKVIVKLLGDGELTHKLTIQVTRASKTAAEKVASAGGSLEVLGA